MPTTLPQVQPTPIELPTAVPKPVISPTPVNPPPQNIILMIVDSLRADHVSAYGYEWPTTPDLDALLAAQGVRFERTIATSPWTCPSLAAMLTGHMPSYLGVTFSTQKTSIRPEFTTLAEYLQEAGYTTAGFVPAYCTKGRFGFNQGFDLYDDSLSDHTGSNKARAEMINQRAVQWLEQEYAPRTGSKRLFLFLYYFDPHVWYDPLPPYNALYDPDYSGALTPAVFAHGGDVVSGKIVPTARDVAHLLAMYDGEITYWDAQVGEMLAYLQANHYLDNTLIVVTADHGEMFGEHSKWVHANGLNEEVLRVPLLMRYTGVIPSGSIVEAPSQNYDLMPTILDWAGVSLPGDLQAMSLREASLGGVVDMERPLFSEIDGVTNKRDDFYWIAPRTPLRSIEQAGWKLIHSPGHAELDELYLLQPASLYETENLIQEQSQRLDSMLYLLNAWFGLKQ